MYIFTLLIMVTIAFVFKCIGAFGVWSRDLSTAKSSKKMMEWAMAHEDEWLPNTDRVVKENGQLHYYGPYYELYFGKHLAYCNGGIVHYGYDEKRGKYGLIFGNDIVFDEYDFLMAQQPSNRLHNDKGERLVKMSKEDIYGIGMKDVYKVVNGEDRYIRYAGEYVEIYKPAYVWKIKRR